MTSLFPSEPDRRQTQATLSQHPVAAVQTAVATQEGTIKQAPMYCGTPKGRIDYEVYLPHGYGSSTLTTRSSICCTVAATECRREHGKPISTP